jgi:hypothetical protein
MEILHKELIYLILNNVSKRDKFIFYNINKHFRNIRPKLYFAVLKLFRDGDGYIEHNFETICDSLETVISKTNNQSYCISLNEIEETIFYNYNIVYYHIKPLFMNE